MNGSLDIGLLETPDYNELMQKGADHEINDNLIDAAIIYLRALSKNPTLPDAYLVLLGCYKNMLHQRIYSPKIIDNLLKHLYKTAKDNKVYIPDDRKFSTN